MVHVRAEAVQTLAFCEASPVTVLRENTTLKHRDHEVGGQQSTALPEAAPWSFPRAQGSPAAPGSV